MKINALLTFNQFGQILLGLSLFILSINFLSKRLEITFKKHLDHLLSSLLDKPFYCFLIGLIVTALIQSSSGTTAIVIILTSASILSIKSGFFFLLGANVGTTVTALMIGLNLEAIAPFIFALSTLLYLIVKSTKIKNICLTSILFSLVFIALNILGSSLETLASKPEFIVFLSRFSANNWFSLLVGTLATAALESSTVLIGLIQVLYANNALQLNSSLALMLGANVGTTFTGYLASIGGKKESRVLAHLNFFFNLIGAVLFICLMTPFKTLINMMNLEPKMEIAFGHFFFNIATFLIFIFLYYLFNHKEIKVKKSKVV